jgi:DNA-binding Lrp family transcriptional regulator
MGLIAMSERDLQRIEVLSKVIDGRMTLVTAAHVLGLSTRQVRRLLERIRTDGAASIRHKAIGRPSNNRISDGVRDYAVTLVRERYTDLSAVSQQQLVALAHHLNSLPRKCLGYRTPRRGVHGTFARLRVIPYPPLVIVALGLDSPAQEYI